MVAVISRPAETKTGKAPKKQSFATANKPRAGSNGHKSQAHHNGARPTNDNATVKRKKLPSERRGIKLVTEIYGGEPYEYYPLGKYIVAAPAVCRGEPTFKYTRIQAFYALDLIAAGWSIERITEEWWIGSVSRQALEEAVKLAADTWIETLSALPLAQ